MKQLYKIALSILFLLPIIVQAQDYPINPETGKVSYSDVVQIDSATQQELYSRAREWFATQFVSANDVIQLDNPKEGKLIGNALAEMIVGDTKQKMYYTLILYLKDGRYKYEITNIVMQGNYSPQIPGADRKVTAEEVHNTPYKFNKKGVMRVNYKLYLDAANATTSKTITSLKKALAGNSSNNNW